MLPAAVLAAADGRASSPRAGWQADRRAAEPGTSGAGRPGGRAPGRLRRLRPGRRPATRRSRTRNRPPRSAPCWSNRAGAGAGTAPGCWPRSPTWPGTAGVIRLVAWVPAADTASLEFYRCGRLGGRRRAAQPGHRRRYGGRAAAACRADRLTWQRPAAEPAQERRSRGDLRPASPSPRWTSTRTSRPTTPRRSGRRTSTSTTSRSRRRSRSWPPSWPRSSARPSSSGPTATSGSPRTRRPTRTTRASTSASPAATCTSRRPALYVSGGIYEMASDQVARYRRAVDDDLTGDALLAAASPRPRRRKLTVVGRAAHPGAVRLRQGPSARRTCCGTSRCIATREFGCTGLAADRRGPRPS